MSRFRRVLLVAAGAALIVAGLIFVRLGLPGLFRRPPVAVAAEPAAPSDRIAWQSSVIQIASPTMTRLMLGDPALRGGPRRATTWQWTEVLARLRGDQIDARRMGTLGTGKYRARATKRSAISHARRPKTTIATTSPSMALRAAS